MVVRTFVRRVVDVVGGSVPLCFIIECNNNEVVAASLNAACRNATLNPVMNPWTRENFRVDITPDVGVWTTHNNKMAMVRLTPALIFFCLRVFGLRREFGCGCLALAGDTGWAAASG